MSDKHLNSLDADLANEGDNVSNEQKLDLTPNWMDMAEDYPEPRYLLQYNGVGFFPLGSIAAITGHKKNGKSMLVCQLMAASLGSKKLGGLQLSSDKNIPQQPTVLYCDTEMERENTNREDKRVHYLCGWDFHANNPRFRTLWLRTEQPDVRWAKIKQAMEEIHPNMVVVDGIRDVISDINDPDASVKLINECMTLASQFDCLLVLVLHQNDGSDKMRGWLGTELGNKVSDTFEVVKVKKDNIVNFTVTQKDARGQDVDDWKFYVDNTRCKFGIPTLYGSEDYQEPDDMKRAAGYLEKFMSSGTPLNFTDIWKGIYHYAREVDDTMSMDDAKELTKVCQMEGLLRPVGNKWKFVGLHFDDNQEELPFPRP